MNSRGRATLQERRYPKPKANRPKFTGEQAGKILALLREAGSKGVSKRHLIFDLHYTQAAARIHELEKIGFIIRHEKRPGDGYTWFVLEKESGQSSENSAVLPAPAEAPVASSNSADWYERETGRPRPVEGPREDLSGLPLFEGVAK